MAEENLHSRSNELTRSSTLRDFLAIGFRQRRLIVGTFLGILCAAVLIAFLLPRKYETQLKILVRPVRADSVVSPDLAPALQLRSQVTDEELESEAELLKSKDLLAKVVLACDLHKRGSSSLWNSIWDRAGGAGENPEGDRKVARAVIALEKDLTVEPIRRTNLISVAYAASDPQLAVRVLNSLANLYLEKHLAMHRVPGAFDFFHQQAEEYRKTLARAETRLADFRREEGVVSPPLEKEITVRKLSDFEAASQQARAAAAETRQRIRTLETQLDSVPRRQTAQVHMADNPQLMQNLKSTLLQLELRRTELLARFEPSYRPVHEVEAQIAQTREAIAAAEKAPLRDETTDRDPTYEALRAELARSKTELAGLQARAAATAGLVQVYRKESQQLDQKEIRQQGMLRAAKAGEENYLLYLRKQEEARISDALDQQRISNVVIAEAATVPIEPRSRRLLVVAVGGFFASVASVILAFAADYWNPSFRTPEEVQSFLGSPVLAAMPKNGD